MYLSTLVIIFYFAVSATSARSLVQGRCTSDDAALNWLTSKLSYHAVLSCEHFPLQVYNSERYWGKQYGKNASVVVFPRTALDVSHAVQAAASSGLDLAFVSGGHGQTNASSSTGFVIDLSWMNQTSVLHNLTIGDTYISTAVSYEGGATWENVLLATNGSGYAPIGARVGDVGVGGFSTGGGIGFLAGAYGYAIDRMRAVEVVLMSGEMILATKTNNYSDIFWALQGGGGQFGIVTKFYQEAVPEPKSSRFGVWVVAPDSWARAQENTVNFFEDNKDPFSLVYYSVGYFPAQLTSGPLGLQMVIVGVQFSNDSANSTQQRFNGTFSALTSGLDLSYSSEYEVAYCTATDISHPFFPSGYRRGFWGPQTTRLTPAYLAAATAELRRYVDAMLAAGEVPATAVWVVQYMHPGLNGHVPASGAATAWPHAVSAHQTLFSPAWNRSAHDALTEAQNARFDELTHAHQARLRPEVVIADYPNYISPGASGRRVWGDNVQRLVSVKEKYDPQCLIHQGRVFASPGCVGRGWANIYPD
ncbi:hypothetical protein MBLNU459_g7044t1 [Dothideomycetes sp. NU459]